MNNIKSILLTTICFVAIVSIIIYSSCNKKNNTVAVSYPCDTIICLNGGICDNGKELCKCPDGYGGGRCQYTCPTRDEYLGTYIDINTSDTAILYSNSNPDKLNLILYNKANFFKDTFVCDLKDCGFGFFDSSLKPLLPKRLDGSLDIDSSRRVLKMNYFGVIYNTKGGSFKGGKQ